MAFTYATAPETIPTKVEHGYTDDRGIEQKAYLTPGKTYRAKYLKGNHFQIDDDNGDKMRCLKVGCAHVDGDWLMSEGE